MQCGYCRVNSSFEIIKELKKMRKILLTLSLFSPIANAGPSHLVNELELTIGRNLSPSAQSLIHRTIPTLGDGEAFIVEGLFSDPKVRIPTFVDPNKGKVCVKRCEGEGENKVCWEVCVD